MLLPRRVILGLLLAVWTSLLLACGGFASFKETQKKFGEANALWDSGNQREAVRHYKSLYSERWIQAEEREMILGRVVQYETSAGHIDEAKAWINRGLDDGYTPKVTDAPAKELLASVQREREVEAKRKEDERLAEEKRKEEERLVEEKRKEKELLAERLAEAKRADAARVADDKRKATPLKSGPAAYDDLSEPWRDSLLKDWKTYVTSCEDAVGSAELLVDKAKGSVSTAENKLGEFIKKHGEKPTETLTLAVLKDKKTALAKAKASLKDAEEAVAERKRALAAARENDPPYLPRMFEGCKTVGDIENRVAMMNAEKAAAEKQRKEEEARRAEAAANQKAEEEYNVKGLVLLRKTVKGTTNRFSTTITGTIENRTGKKMKYVQISYHVYDASGAKVGTALANVAGLEAGAKWNFKAIALVSNGEKFKVDEITGF